MSTATSASTDAPIGTGGLVSIEGLTKRFTRDRAALDEVSVSIEPGTTLCVLGPSGCGKSTLLRLVAGLDAPDGGRIVVGDRVLSGHGRVVPPNERGINMVFQDYALWPHMTIRDIVGYGLRVGANRTDAATRTARVDELLRMLRLTGLERRRPAEVSGGQQQRVAIARALATSPQLLLFDEPLSNLDAQLRGEMREELAMLLEQLGTTVLYVTHDVTEALALADRILVLHEGRTVQLDTPHEVFSHPRSGWVASLAGFSSVLDLDRVLIDAPGHAEAHAAGVRIHGRYCGTDESDGGRRRAYVHPDAVHLRMEDGDVVGTVETSVFEGRGHRSRIRLGAAGTLVLHSEHKLDRGEMARVVIDPDGVLVFGSATPRTTVGPPTTIAHPATATATRPVPAP